MLEMRCCCCCLAYQSRRWRYNERTVSGSRCCSRKAENSTSRNLWVAMARPSHGGGGAGGVRPAVVAATVVTEAADEDEGALLLGVADEGARRPAISAEPPLPADEPVPPFDVPDLLFAEGLAPTA